jgi:endonuclease I
MRGDVHHLFACQSACNSFRGNRPYFDFVDFGEAVRDDCGKWLAEQGYEPRHGKGAVARATLYFLLRYPREINRVSNEYEEDRIALLVEWHKAEDVTEYERHRNAAIFEKQGNRNPLIDHPDWAEEIAFTRGLGPAR